MAEGAAPPAQSREGATKDKNKSIFAELGDIVKSYIFPILAVLGLGLMTYFVYVPAVTSIPEAISDQKLLDKNIETLDSNLAKLEEFNSMPLDSMSETLDTLIPTEARVAELVSELNALAEQSGLQVTIPENDDLGDEQNDNAYVEDIIAGEADNGTDYQVSRVPVSLSFSGTRSQVEQFIELIKSDDRVLSVQSASIQAGAHVWQVDLVINGYKGEIVTTSLPDSTRIDADSELVLSTIKPINNDLTTQAFYEVTSQYTN